MPMIPNTHPLLERYGVTECCVYNAFRRMQPLDSSGDPRLWGEAAGCKWFQSCVAASIFDPMEKRTDQQQAIDTAAYTHE